MTQRPEHISQADELAARLRERYTGVPVPPCRICGGPLSIQRAGGGEATVWGCSTHEDDPDNPGRLRKRAGRSDEWWTSQHYSDSKWTQYQPGDSDVIDLLDRLANTPAGVPREATAEMIEAGRISDGDDCRLDTMPGIDAIRAERSKEISAIWRAMYAAALDAAPQSEGECELCGDTGLCGFDPGPQFCNCKAGRGAIAEYRRHEALSRRVSQSEGVGWVAHNGSDVCPVPPETIISAIQWTAGGTHSFKPSPACEIITDQGRWQDVASFLVSPQSRHAPVGQREGVIEEAERGALADRLTALQGCFFEESGEAYADMRRAIEHIRATPVLDIRAATIEEWPDDLRERMSDRTMALIEQQLCIIWPRPDSRSNFEELLAEALFKEADERRAASTGDVVGGERAQIVAWLRQQTGHPEACEDAQRSTAFYSSVFADSIEAGEHVAALSPKSGEVRP